MISFLNFKKRLKVTPKGSKLSNPQARHFALPLLLPSHKNLGKIGLNRCVQTRNRPLNPRQLKSLLVLILAQTVNNNLNIVVSRGVKNISSSNKIRSSRIGNTNVRRNNATNFSNVSGNNATNNSKIIIKSNAISSSNKTISSSNMMNKSVPTKSSGTDRSSTMMLLNRLKLNTLNGLNNPKMI